MTTTTPSSPVDRVQSVESVKRALRILRCFSVEQPELGVTDVARSLEMHKSTIHRLLVTMEREGFVYQLDNGRYALSFTLLEIAAGVAAWQGMQETIIDSLKVLAEESGETAHLAVLDADSVLYVEKVEGKWSLRMPSSVGKRVPLNCTGLGKVLLAGMAKDEARRIIYSGVWEARTPNSIVDPDMLLREIEIVRSNGYALDREEIEEGLLCIAAPIVDDRGETCAGISIAAPASRLSSHLETGIKNVTSTAARLSRTLGAQARHLKEASRDFPSST